MNPPDLIANKILEFLRPDSYDDHEEKLIRERDEIRKGKVTLIDKGQIPIVKNLGWENGWEETPELVKKCREQKHKISDRDIGPPMRGIDHEVRCDICGYIYHYDSSD